MVICKFYLQGTCKFGENCKFEHQGNDSNRGGSTSILRQQAFPGTASNANNIDTNTLIRSVQNDMLNSEKGGQWLLSSYAPFKDKPAFPGFEDRSFEEVRLGYYEAKLLGTVEQYTQQLQMGLQEAVAKIKALQNPNPDIVNIIKEIYNTPVKSQFGQPPSNFNNQTNNQIYPTATPTLNNYNNQQNVFGQTNTSTSPNNIFAMANQKLFGQQRPMFANNTASTNNFGGNMFNQGNPIFNTPPQTMQNSIFNSQPPQNNVFSQPQSTSILNKSPPNMFSNMQPSAGYSAVNVQEQKALFPQQTANNYGQPFQTQMSFTNPVSSVNSPLTNPYATTAAQQPAFSQFVPQPNSGPFGQQVNSQFTVHQTGALQNQNLQEQSTNNVQTSSTMFGKAAGVFNQNVTQNIFGTITNPVIDNKAYSKLEDLTENEIKAFQSNRFEFGQIPERPPTSEMCK